MSLTENLCSGVVREQCVVERKNIVIDVEITNDILTKQNVIALSWGKGLVANPAIYHRVVCTGLRSHPNNLVTRFTARAGKVPGAIVVRFVFLFQC